jgi:hypothetical protein
VCRLLRTRKKNSIKRGGGSSPQTKPAACWLFSFSGQEMSEPICKQCENRETEFRLIGHEYKPVIACIYDMANYPHLRKCAKFLQEGDGYGDDD